MLRQEIDPTLEHSVREEAATALAIAERTGRIAPGLSADFLVLESDPLADLAALRDPEAVVFRGEWFSRAKRLDQVARASRGPDA